MWRGFDPKMWEKYLSSRVLCTGMETQQRVTSWMHTFGIQDRFQGHKSRPPYARPASLWLYKPCLPLLATFLALLLSLCVHDNISVVLQHRFLYTLFHHTHLFSLIGQWFQAWGRHASSDNIVWCLVSNISNQAHQHLSVMYLDLTNFLTDLSTCTL